MSERGITVRSGSAIGTKTILKRAQSAKERAIQLGIVSMLAKHLNTVAFKSGDFSRAVESSYQNQQRTQKGRREITIKLERGTIIAEVPYGVYHINPGGSFGTFYQNPTTPNTKPIDEFLWNETVADEIEALIPAEMVKEGLIVSDLLASAGSGGTRSGQTGRFVSLP
ncbi:hypothetical protein LCGC14_2741570 [marine sediment metagenome]|uniref:Uncharacterized protein n=1 Tax=marine sediment metagenome TaxID=412755 RepID=A0A0F9BD63_9ZZZZ